MHKLTILLSVIILFSCSRKVKPPEPCNAFISCGTEGCDRQTPDILTPVVPLSGIKVEAADEANVSIRFHFDNAVMSPITRDSAVFKMLADANDNFEGFINFTLPTDSLYYASDIGGDIDHFMNDPNWYKAHSLEAHADDALINIYVLETQGYVYGFTFLPAAWMDLTQDQRWNSIFLAETAVYRNTISHELGHFFGLSHNFYVEDLHNCDDVDNNNMSYLSCRDEFTPSQIDTMATVLYELRPYLLN